MRMLGIVLVAIGLIVLALLPTLWAPMGGSAEIVSPDGWAWQNPLPQGNRLRDVWGNSSTDVFAVGNFGTILHYDGDSWSQMSSGTTEDLHGVWGASSSDVFAVGWNGTILHYDGSSWVEVSTGTTTCFWDVWGSSSSDVFAVGSTILHYNGSSWSEMSSGTTEVLRDVWGTSSTDVFAVGHDGAIVHYDGSSWSEMTSGTTDYLFGVWGSSSNDVFAVQRNGAILHYDGSSWSEMTSGIPWTSLWSVWGTSSTDVFAVGNSGTVLHYDGSTWSEMGSGTTSDLHCVWGTSSTDVFAVGLHGTILHYDGISWSEMSSGTKECLYGVWGNSSTDIFAVGDHGAILHYDGSSWSEMSSGTTNRLYGVWGNSSTDVFAVGNFGTILHYDGSSWSGMSSGTGQMLRSVWGTSSTDIFAVGWDVILHYDGSSWSQMGSSSNANLLGVWGCSPSNVFAVGLHGAILHYNGSWWGEMSSGTTGNLWGVWGSSCSNVFAVGEMGTIVHYNGSWWSEMSIGTTGIIHGVWGTSSTDVFAVGAMWHYDGSTWSWMNSGVGGGLYGVWGTSSTDVFAVGTGGRILHYFEEITCDVTVTSDGCCPISVEWNGTPHIVDAGASDTFALDCDANVTVTALPSDSCYCEDIELDGVSQGCDPVTFNMDGNDHVVDVYCREYAPIPEPCCWCIYEVWWWEGEEPPSGDPDNREYHCLHCEDWLPPGHIEYLPGGIGTHVIPDPCFHQETFYFAGPEPNGYPEAEWEQPTAWYELSGISRHTIFLGLLQLYGMQGLGSWSSDNLINWKTRYDWLSPHPLVPPWSVTLDIIPVSGGPGWPWAVGDSWITIGMSSITPPSATYTAVVGTENVTAPFFPGGIECYRVESYSWIDVNGVDDDGDGAVDEDPFNQYDDDGDGLTDEDGGDGVPDPGELTPSSTDWWNNDYGCSIKKETYPGATYMGWEHFYMVWYGTGPPFPPWEPTYNLTVDQSASCCSVDVGAPIGATVSAGTSQTFTDLEYEVVISVYADDSDPCCEFVSWSDGGTQTHDVYMDGDKSVTATCDWLDSDLTVNSCGCCSVQVDWDSNQVIVPAGGTEVIPDISCCNDVMVTAVTTDDCLCDDIDVDSTTPGCPCELPAGNCPTITVHMDGNDHVVDVCCREYAPVPEPCCWCIYEVDWWLGEEPPAGDPHRREYHCLHCVEWLDANHTEPVGAPFPGGVHVIPDPSFHQEVTFYAGPVPNGYGVAEWDTIHGLIRLNILLMEIYLNGMGYWNSQYDLINWKTSYDVTTPIGPITYYYGTLAIIPVSGNPGWPYAVGNSWINIDMSHVSPPAAIYHECSSTENVTTPLFPGGIECYRVESYSWADVDGVDDDGDGAVDEDPFNQYDDDSDGLTDEDGGDGVPDPGELTLSSTDWWNNDYGCSIKKETYPGTMYMGWEHFYMVWYCTDPPFPPWEPTYNLTVDQSASCCSVEVGAPVGATVAAGTSQTFTDLECEVVISVNADNSAPCCDFDQWTGDTDLYIYMNSNQVTMDGDKVVTATCVEPTYDLTVDQSESCCPVIVGLPAGDETVVAGGSQVFDDISCNATINLEATTDGYCTFGNWTGNVANPGSASTSITMHGDETVTAECSEATPTPWDVNMDGYVNEEDMNLVYDHFGETGDPGWIQEDVKEDGRIDVLDMILVGQHWSQ